MLILAADTSGKHGSIGLVRCETGESHTIEAVPLEGGTFSAQLIPQIAGLLSRHNLSKLDIDAFAVVCGPGSFTGLRVGLAAIKALAEILRKPIATVSLLELIAFPVNSELKASGKDRGDEVLTALDAGRQEVFAGEYRIGSELPLCLKESLLTIDELADRAKQRSNSLLTADENLIQSLSRAGLPASAIIQVQRPNASTIAQLGYRKILAGLTVAPEKLDATYIRRADAEINKTVRTPR
jgi:tRNA threonylcarbamoyladenosine biosynthesis protein TsaB